MFYWYTHTHTKSLFFWQADFPWTPSFLLKWHILRTLKSVHKPGKARLLRTILWPALVHGVCLILLNGSSDEETHYYVRMSTDTCASIVSTWHDAKENRDQHRRSNKRGKHECGMQETEGTYLVTIPCKAATFHGARVEVTLIVKLEHRQAGVDVIEYRGQATPQSQELGAVAVESHAHGTLEG